MTALDVDHDLAIARSATGLLRLFNEAGVLGLADVHTAIRVSAIARETDERVQLALALAVRALRVGSVCVDLTTAQDTVFDDSEEQIDVTDLPWPDPAEWLEAVTASPLVTVGAETESGRPLRLAFNLLYLERYWLQEEIVRIQLQTRRTAEPPIVDLEHLERSLDRIFGSAAEQGKSELQRQAAQLSAEKQVMVLAGGPGTGKTTTVAKLLALLCDQPGPRLRIALAAPTGKAAARLEEAVNEARAGLPQADQDRLGVLKAATLHRLLGWLPNRRGRFRHDASNHLPYDVIVVDEMSMVSLTLMARLLEATRPDARLVLVGDPDQLSSVEAGAVLADVVQAVDPEATMAEHGVVRLQHTWRFDGAIDTLARAIRRGDADEAIGVLRSGAAELSFNEVDLAPAQPEGLGPLITKVAEAGLGLSLAAQGGEAAEALRALDDHRLLCAHRRGPYGVSRWSREAERWLYEAIPGYGEDGEWYVGRPVLVTVNDYDTGLYNGDTGVVINTPGGRRVAFARGAAATLHAPVRLDDVQTVHAMTVHRSQGSQFRTVSFIVPPPESPLLTRELLYTAVTRATEQVLVFGSEEAIRRAIARPARRASGLRNRLG